MTNKYSAIPNFLKNMEQELNDAATKAAETDPEIEKYRYAYMHGRLRGHLSCLLGDLNLSDAQLDVLNNYFTNEV